ncbi:hypothetical protein [Nocardia sp. NBC_01327]|uniref:hypothetical protein n=1 Tax=Nocardia sp. NBC_01327 TaxID=2903593 RepID=UPI002E0FD65C|nr:hypothetical protein OG326_33230 [Nocardia sp. NBC_01327]
MMSDANARTTRSLIHFAAPFAVLYGSIWITDPEIGKLTLLLPYSILWLLWFPGLPAVLIASGAELAERVSISRGWGARYQARSRMVLLSLLGGFAGLLVVTVLGEVYAAICHERDLWMTVLSWRFVIYLPCPLAAALVAATLPIPSGATSLVDTVL